MPRRMIECAVDTMHRLKAKGINGKIGKPAILEVMLHTVGGTEAALKRNFDFLLKVKFIVPQEDGMYLLDHEEVEKRGWW